MKFLKDSCNIPIERAKMELKFYSSYHRESNRNVHNCFQKNNGSQFLIAIQEANNNNKKENEHNREYIHNAA